MIIPRIVHMVRIIFNHHAISLLSLKRGLPQVWMIKQIKAMCVIKATKKRRRRGKNMWFQPRLLSSLVSGGWEVTLFSCVCLKISKDQELWKLIIYKKRLLLIGWNQSTLKIHCVNFHSTTKKKRTRTTTITWKFWIWD